MKKNYLLASFFWTFVLWIPPYSLVNGFVCPDGAKILPCTCEITIFGNDLLCTGTSVTQEIVSGAIAEARLSNNITGLEKLELTGFTLGGTYLTTVDLTPFLLLRLDTLLLSENPLLSSIVGPDLAIYNGSIHLSELLIHNCNSLTDSGMGDTLKYISPSNFTYLSFVDSGISGGQYIFTDGNGNPSVEFLPGLSQLTHLSVLSLAGNQIRVISGGQFKSNKDLTSLSLHSNSNLKIGEGAFLIDESVEPLNQSLDIQLGFNDFITSDFNCLNVISPFGRPITLLMHEIKNVDHLTVQFFHPFLMAHPANRIVFYFGANFHCDSRMNWLKDQRELFENRVQGCWCRNYPEDTCFTFP